MTPDELLRLTQSVSNNSGPLLHAVVVAMALLVIGALCRGWRERTPPDPTGPTTPPMPPPMPPPGPPAAPERTWRRDIEGPEASLAVLARFDVPEMLAVRPLETVVSLLDTILSSAAESYVLFRHGTFVFLDVPPEQAVEAARARMQANGFVGPGGPAGDFRTATITDERGWAVDGHDDRMMTLVLPEELGGVSRSDLEIGLIGRAKRHLDAGEQQVVHVGTLRRADDRASGDS